MAKTQNEEDPLICSFHCIFHFLRRLSSHSPPPMPFDTDNRLKCQAGSGMLLEHHFVKKEQVTVL